MGKKVLKASNGRRLSERQNPVARRLTEIRMARGLTQTKAAERAKLSVVSLNRIEQEGSGRFSTIVALAKLYKVSLDWISTGKGEDPIAEAAA